jgi:hypothetical protein
MSNLSVFNFADQEIRVVGTPEWPLWVAMDVCNILEVKNPSDALKRLDDDEKDNLVLTDAIGRNKEMAVVTESGLYSLVLSSRKPQAKAFKKWITSEVIPAIRRSGSYSTQALPPEPASTGDPELDRFLLALERARAAGLDISSDIEYELNLRDRFAQLLGVPKPTKPSTPKPSTAIAIAPPKTDPKANFANHYKGKLPGQYPAHRAKAWNGDLWPLVEIATICGYPPHSYNHSQLGAWIAQRVKIANACQPPENRIQCENRPNSLDPRWHVWHYEDCPGLEFLIHQFFDQP